MASNSLEFESDAHAGHVVGGLLDVHELLGEFGMLRDRLHHVRVLLAGLGGRCGGEGLPAPHAPFLALGRLPVTPRAGDGRELVGAVLFGHLEAHHLRVLVADVVVEDGGVSGNGVRAVGSALSALDVPGVHALPAEPGEVGLPERGRRDVLRDVCSPGGSLEHVEERVVGESVGVVELRPDEVVAIAGMVGEPPVDVRRRRDEVDRPLTGLAVDADGEAVVGVGDVAESEVVEFPTAESGVELEGDRRLVTSVPALLEHRFDVVFPAAHVPGRRARVVVSGERGVDPADGLGRVTAVLLGRTPAEDPEGDPVVLVRLGRLVEVVGIMDPADDLLGGVAVLEGVGDRRRRVLGDADAVPQELLVPVVSVRFTEEFQLIAELHEDLTVAFVVDLTLSSLDLLAKRRDSPLGIRHSPIFKRWLLRVWLKALPWLSSLCLHANGDGGGKSTLSPPRRPLEADESYNAIDNSAGFSPEVRCPA